MDHDSLDFPGRRGSGQARRAWTSRARKAVAQRTASQSIPLYPLLTAAADYYRQALKSHPTRKSAVTTLKGRGLTGEIARDFGLGFAPPGWDNLQSTWRRQACSRKP